MTEVPAPATDSGNPPAPPEAGVRAPSLTRAVALARRAPPWAWLAGLGLVIAIVAWAGTGYVYVPMASLPADPPAAGDSRLAASKTREQLTAENNRLRARLGRLAPQGTYIIVNQTENRLYVKQGGRELLAAACSSGSGMILRQEGTNRSWVFDTPRGRFTVQSKLVNPVWRRPDWAFVEENLPVPKDPAERLEYGSLGEYALYLGEGYMIHGTLYERLLGRSVTHGCIRLGRDDLRTVYRLVPVGAQVFIY